MVLRARPAHEGMMELTTITARKLKFNNSMVQCVLQMDTDGLEYATLRLPITKVRIEVALSPCDRR
jgi:hypothetical protein